MLRSIKFSDRPELKQLHEEFFPIRYSDSFYDDACKGIGIGGGEIIAIIAEDAEKIVGFVLSQVFRISEVEDHDLFDSTNTPEYVCYILTIGAKEEYRRQGLGSKLLRNCVEQAQLNKSCGAIYLHVIHYNTAGIKFYERNDFHHLRTLKDYYLIGGVHYTAYLYIRYVNGFDPPGGEVVQPYSITSFFSYLATLLYSILYSVPVPSTNDIYNQDTNISKKDGNGSNDVDPEALDPRPDSGSQCQQPANVP